MEYFNENMSTEEILNNARIIAVPGGRENGNVTAYLKTMGIDAPGITGRCLHIRR
ncbi:MAG: hypothetical protein QG628_875 [Patescibacteria group bacterium]|nr:hypothetical protein [Patescibacteria group bacterium]